jgi:plastocyanin
VTERGDRLGELAEQRVVWILEIRDNYDSRREISMRVFVASVIVALSISAWGCGSSTDSPQNPVAPTPTPTPAPTPAPTPTPTPTPTPAPPGGMVTINVVSINGAQSFSPNPATLPAGQMVVWHNIDSITHRVVLNNGSLDTGDIAPGASSRPMSINTGGGPYHCSIHPSMVGTLVPPASTYARE